MLGLKLKSKHEKFIYFSNLIVFVVSLLLLPFGAMIGVKLLVGLLCIVLFSFSYAFLLKIMRTVQNRWVGFFVLLAWLVCLTLVLVFMSSVLLFGTATAHIEVGSVLVASFIAAALGLVFTAPIWMALLMMDSIVWLPNINR
tara:strand:- start:73621 stop:74046 length:426 start_codon:yes stop_codon:yes gene_type:complete